MKQFLTTLFIILGTFSLKAQDNIYLRKGDVLEVHIKKVSGNLIYYTATTGGPQRYIRKDAVERILYKNGREVVMPDPNKKHGRVAAIPSNVITLSLNAIYTGKIGGLSGGLDYEHYFGERHLISVHVPVHIALVSNQESDANGQPITSSPYTDAVLFYASPGVHFHPINAHKRLDYSVGISAVIGNVNQTDYYEHSWVGGANVDRQLLLAAVTLDNDLNFFSKKKFTFGFHTTFGPVFGEYGKDGKWLVEVGLKLGFRF